MKRREFLKSAATGIGAAALPLEFLAHANLISSYSGPNVVIVRFGGGVRRQEVLDAEGTYAPYFLNELVPQGTLFRNIYNGSSTDRSIL